MRRRSLIAGSVSAAPGAALYGVVPEPAPAQAASATPWYEEPLGGPRAVETAVNEDNNPVSCTAQGHDSSGNLVVRSGSISDTATTAFKKLSADDQRLIAGVTQRWEEDGNEIRLTGSTNPYHPGPRSTDEEKAAYWQPCPSGGCPKSSRTGAGKDFHVCCGVSFFNGWPAPVVCPACLAACCTRWTYLSFPTKKEKQPAEHQ